ncbi:type II secretion system F family protein [Lutispora saccharofermentans]|uniref:Type II secretion system F family protein n=1 Tax=Lutispora saccharofermentans TaxID=3024236 RepID=A0ABT1NIU6_9FIRM|nr:type II secretion system F family protein [Lutispora saccharofermentans]MCQ1529801.1 type II secretion system F family protein [Lutispora saccharofermentans]
MQFKYRAVTETGQIIEGIHDAQDEEEVISMLKGSDYMPISIEQTINSGASTSITLKKVKKKDLAVFCRQFYTMLNAGVSIVKCLDVLEKQTENKQMKNAIADVFDNVQKGMTLSEAMKNNPKIYPPILINMVEAGEASGSLDTIMERMAVHYEKEFKIENKVKGAMVYPMVLAVVATAVVVFLMVAVMPTFVGMFESSGVELPGPTKALLAISHSLRNLWYMYMIGIIALVSAVKYYDGTENGSLVFDTIKLRVPIFKNVNIKLATSRFTRTLSTLLSSGIPLMQGIDIVARVVGNKYISNRLDEAKEDIRKGVPLSRTIKDAGIFPPMVDSMIKIGEESGDLDGILNKSADFYDEEVEAALQKMTEMMQPLMVVIMALIVGFIVISIALPMFDMVNTI